MNRHLYDEEALMKDYPLAARTAHPEGTIIPVGSTAIGGENLTLIAGPCAVESREQLFATAAAVKAAGATILRGGTYKPRTSPYAFAGLGEEGLRLLAEAGREFQLPTVSEITDAALLPQFEEIDILQVGARNMQNYTLLQALGRQSKPILLKRGLAATYEEWLASAEYILREGNPHVILCERGIRSYQSGTRATLDLAAIPVMQGLTHLPVLVDPSHASGAAGWIPALGRAAIGGSPHKSRPGPQRWGASPSSAGFCPPGRRCPQNLGTFAPLNQSFFSLKKSWAPAASRTGCHLSVAPRRRRQDEIMS